MTGRRRDKGTPLSVVRRAQLSWENFQRCLARATKPSHRVSAACGYLQAVLERADPKLEALLAEQAFSTLVELASRGDAATVAAARRAMEREAVEREANRRSQVAPIAQFVTEGKRNGWWNGSGTRNAPHY